MRLIEKPINHVGSDRRIDTLLFYGYEFVSAFIPGVLALMIYKRIKPYDTKEQKAGATILLTIFIIYLVGVYHYTGVGTVFEGIRYGFDKTTEYNLVPFSTKIDIMEHILNVVLFVPLGLLVPLMCDKKNKLYQIIILGVGLSLLIEVSQDSFLFACQLRAYVFLFYLYLSASIEKSRNLLIQRLWQ